jgi:hypothetical protein
VAEDLHDVIALSGPSVIHERRSGVGKVHFATVHDDLPLAGSHGPNNHNFVLFTSTFDPRLTVGERGLIGETKTPRRRRRRRRRRTRKS